jgi:hypothetical protein
MLTLMQLKVSKAKRKLTQEQRAQIVDIEVAMKFVLQAIEETLAVNRHIPEGLSEEDLDRIFNNQPVHFDDMAMFLTGSSVRPSSGGGSRCVAHVTGASTSKRSSRRRKDKLRFGANCRQPGHYTRFGVISGWAVTRPEPRISALNDSMST